MPYALAVAMVTAVASSLAALGTLGAGPVSYTHLTLPTILRV